MLLQGQHTAFEFLNSLFGDGGTGFYGHDNSSIKDASH